MRKIFRLPIIGLAWVGAMAAWADGPSKVVLTRAMMDDFVRLSPIVAALFTMGAKAKSALPALRRIQEKQSDAMLGMAIQQIERESKSERD